MCDFLMLIIQATHIWTLAWLDPCWVYLWLVLKNVCSITITISFSCRRWRCEHIGLKTLIDPGSDKVLECKGIVTMGHICTFLSLNTISICAKNFKVKSSCFTWMINKQRHTNLEMWEHVNTVVLWLLYTRHGRNAEC